MKKKKNRRNTTNSTIANGVVPFSLFRNKFNNKKTKATKRRKRNLTPFTNTRTASLAFKSTGWRNSCVDAALLFMLTVILFFMPRACPVSQSGDK